MRRLVIAIDCDDVLVPTAHFFVDEYNRRYGTHVDIEKAHEADYDGWGVPHEVMLDRFGAMLATDTYRKLGPSQEEIAILKELSKDHELHVVTARRPEERPATQAMIDRDLPGIFDSLTLVGFEGSKGSICEKIGADILIDDNARHLEGAIECGLPPEGALLFGDYAWNASATGFTRCRDWSEVKTEILRLAGQ